MTVIIAAVAVDIVAGAAVAFRLQGCRIFPDMLQRLSHRLSLTSQGSRTVSPVQ